MANDMTGTLDLAVAAIRGADPARFGDPTPCPEFTVAALIDHMAETPMPAAMIGSLMTAEFALHAWDLAVATGQPLDVPDDLGRAVLAGVTPVAQMGRDGGWYGAEVPVPDTASAWEKALAASGRDPART